MFAWHEIGWEGGTTVQANTVSTTGASGLSGAVTNGSIVSINTGVFYVGGYFVFKDAETLILEKYSDTPSYRVGLQVTESIITSDTDTSLLDPAQGAYNYAAQGANRYKIVLDLSAKTFTATDPVENAADENFFQLLKVLNGVKQEETKYPVYSELEKTLARRTFDESGDYVGALDWFTTAIKEDSSHSDAYNGVGWTMGHLRQADSSVYYFNKYLNRDSTAFENILDFYAGLSFAYNAIGDDGNARLYGQTYFFGNQNSEIGDPDWCFCHKTDINQLDVRLVLAISEYRLGLFENAQSSINSAYGDLSNQLKGGSNNSTATDYLDINSNGTFDSGDELFNGEWQDAGTQGILEEGEIKYFDEYPLNYDYNTVLGRTYLANHLSLLQDHLSVKNGENGLSCFENNGKGGGYCQ